MLLGVGLSAELERRVLFGDVALEVTFLQWNLCPIVGAAGTADEASAGDLALSFCFEGSRTF